MCGDAPINAIATASDATTRAVSAFVSGTRYEFAAEQLRRVIIDLEGRGETVRAVSDITSLLSNVNA